MWERVGDEQRTHSTGLHLPQAANPAVKPKALFHQTKREGGRDGGASCGCARQIVNSLRLSCPQPEPESWALKVSWRRFAEPCRARRRKLPSSVQSSAAPPSPSVYPQPARPAPPDPRQSGGEPRDGNQHGFLVCP